MSNNILIVYYSQSGNTQKLAKLIQQKAGGTIVQIQPQEAYPAPYSSVVEQARREIQADYRPTLKTQIQNIEKYNIVFIGTPNWCSTIAPPIATFLESYDLSGKTIIPFCTHGGGGFGNIERDVTKLCPNSTILSGIAIYRSNVNDSQLSAWLKNSASFQG